MAQPKKSLRPALRALGWLLPLILLVALATRLPFLRLGAPVYLWLLLVLPALAWLEHWSSRQMSRQGDAFIAAPLLARIRPARALSPWPARLLLAAALASLILALARPQGAPIAQEAESSGIDIVIAVDISHSMMAQDVYPSRLAAAKDVILDLLQELSGDRVGLIVFSGEAMSMSPLTDDYGALETLVNEINSGLLPSGGTDLNEVLILARERFRPSRDVGRILLVLSDGETHTGQVEEAVRQLRQDGVYIYTVGIGTHQGAKIPEKEDFWGNKVYKTYQGEEIVSRLEEGTLRKIAELGQGKYFPAGNRWGLNQSIQGIRAGMQKGTFRTSSQLVYEEKFQWYLLLALLCLLLERLLALGIRPWPAGLGKRGAALLKWKPGRAIWRRARSLLPKRRVASPEVNR